jgi:hypothetical protein
MRIQTLQKAFARMYDEMADRRIFGYDSYEIVEGCVVIHVIYAYPALDCNRDIACPVSDCLHVKSTCR